MSTTQQRLQVRSLKDLAQGEADLLQTHMDMGIRATQSMGGGHYLSLTPDCFQDMGQLQVKLWSSSQWFVRTRHVAYKVL